MSDPLNPTEPNAPDGPGTQTLPGKDVDTDTREKFAPMYHVLLHDDDKHSYEYVIVMLMRLFGKSKERAFLHAVEVDNSGVTIVETTNLERAELKRDQIKAFGADSLIVGSPGSMYASIEPVEME